MRDNAPVGNTCPKIDSVIALISNMDNYDINEESEYSDLQKDIKEAIRIMEEIRSANSELRGWGNDLYIDKDDLENQNYKLTDIISELEGKVSALESEAEELTIEFNEFEKQPR